MALGVLGASLFLFLATAALTPRESVEALHNWGRHAINFHGCDWITYETQTHSPGVVSKATMDSYIGQALDNGQGWDQMCGNKFVRWGNPWHVYYSIGPASWVNDNCGSVSWGCAYQHDCWYDSYGGVICQFEILMRDTASHRIPFI
jgi:hypothetical protein